MTRSGRPTSRAARGALAAATLVFVSTVALVIADVVRSDPPVKTPLRTTSAARPSPAVAVRVDRRDEAVDAADLWLAVEECAYEDLAAGQWMSALGRIDDPSMERCLRLARASRVHDLEDAILREAARRRRFDDGLWCVFDAATKLRRSEDADARERGRRAVAWASAKALVPYGMDRREFSRAYRAVRFGDGRLDVAGGAPVRRFAFDEAASLLATSRGAMGTWLYERRVLDEAARLQALARDWTTCVAELKCFADDGDTTPLVGVVASAEGRVVTLDRRQPESDDSFSVVVDEPERRWSQRIRWADLAPARVADALFLPRIGRMTTPTVVALARIFAETGEAAAAETCRAAAAKRDASIDGDADLVAEIAALADLAKICGRTMPDDVRASRDLDDWARRHGATHAAHAVLGLGARDIGSFDDAAVDAYVAGGVLWAPEQWALVRARLDAASPVDREKLHGFEIECDHFTVFTDVSAEFAAEASLVLDASYEQIAMSLSLVPDAKQRVVIYRNRADFDEHGFAGAGGCWCPSDRTIRTFFEADEGRRFAQYDYSTLVHEAAHAVLGTGVRHYPPSWMHEGVACFYERWNPTRSIRRNEAATGASVQEPWRLRDALTTGDFPDLAALFAMKREWDVDHFGRKTRLRYAAAETLFVHLMTDPKRRRIVDRFIAAVNADEDPETRLTADETSALQKSWLAFVRSAAR